MTAAPPVIADPPPWSTIGATRRPLPRGTHGRNAMVAALVMIKAETDKVTALAEALTETEGVSEVFSVAGRWDLVAIVRTRDNDRPETLYLDCSELAATIRSDIGAKTRLDMPHEWLLPNASLTMLRALSAMWGAQPTRRYSRMRFKPRAGDMAAAGQNPSLQQVRLEIERATADLGLSEDQLAKVNASMKAAAPEPVAAGGSAVAGNARPNQAAETEARMLQRLKYALASVVSEPQRGAFEAWKARFEGAARKRREVTVWVLAPSVVDRWMLQTF